MIRYHDLRILFKDIDHSFWQLFRKLSRLRKNTCSGAKSVLQISEDIVWIICWSFALLKLKMKPHPFVPDASFLYPLAVFWGFQVVEKGCIRKEWVNTANDILQKFFDVFKTTRAALDGKNEKWKIRKIPRVDFS